MPSRHRCIFVAIAGFMILGNAALRPDQGKDSHERQPALTSKVVIAPNAKQAQARCFPGSALGVSCDAIAAEAAVAQAKDADKQAAPIWWQLALGFATLVAAIFAAIFAWLAAHHTKRGADAAHASQRPWLTFSIDVQRMTVNDLVHNFTVGLSIKNAGGTPAVQAVVASEFFDPFAQGNEPNHWVKECLTEYASRDPIGFMIAPNEEHPWEVSNHWTSTSHVAGNTIRMLVVSICYRSTDGSVEARQSAKGFLIHYPQRSFPSFIFEAEFVVPNDDFSIKPANNISVAI